MTHRMIRMSCLAVLVLAVFQRPVAAKTKQNPSLGISARNFVQGFYDWYVPIALKDNPVPASDIAVKQRPYYFSRRLVQALREDPEAQAKVQGYIVGLGGWRSKVAQSF